jgi:hypothetical protein
LPGRNLPEQNRIAESAAAAGRAKKNRAGNY